MRALPVDEPESGVGGAGVEMGDIVGEQGFAQEHGGDDVHMVDFGGNGLVWVFRLPLGRILGVARADKEQGGGEEVVGDAVAVLPLVRAVEQPEFGGGAGEHECPKEPPDGFGAGIWGAADDKRGLQEPAVEREPEPETFGQGDGAAVLGGVVLPEVEGEGGEEGEKGEQAIGGHGVYGALRQPESGGQAAFIIVYRIGEFGKRVGALWLACGVVLTMRFMPAGHLLFFASPKCEPAFIIHTTAFTP